MKEVSSRSTPTIVSIEFSGHSPIEDMVNSRYILSIVSIEFSGHSPIEEHGQLQIHPYYSFYKVFRSLSYRGK